MNELKTIKQLEPFKDIIGKILGYPFEEIGGIIGDPIRYLRIKILIILFKKFKKLLKNNNIEPQKIPLKILSPLLESASLEEDESLSDRWAELLLSASNPSTSKNVRPAFIEILKTLTPIEAKILDDIYNNSEKTAKGKIQRKPINIDYVTKKFNLSKPEYTIINENFIRLNLCNSPVSGGTTWGSITLYRDNKEVILTPLGIAFIEACSAKKLV